MKKIYVFLLILTLTVVSMENNDDENFQDAISQKRGIVPNEQSDENLKDKEKNLKVQAETLEKQEEKLKKREKRLSANELNMCNREKDVFHRTQTLKLRKQKLLESMPKLRRETNDERWRDGHHIEYFSNRCWKFEIKMNELNSYLNEDKFPLRQRIEKSFAQETEEIFHNDEKQNLGEQETKLKKQEMFLYERDKFLTTQEKSIHANEQSMRIQLEKLPRFRKEPKSGCACFLFRQYREHQYRTDELHTLNLYLKQSLFPFTNRVFRKKNILVVITQFLNVKEFAHSLRGISKVTLENALPLTAYLDNDGIIEIFVKYLHRDQFQYEDLLQFCSSFNYRPEYFDIYSPDRPLENPNVLRVLRFPQCELQPSANYDTRKFLYRFKAHDPRNRRFAVYFPFGPFEEEDGVVNAMYAHTLYDRTSSPQCPYWNSRWVLQYFPDGHVLAEHMYIEISNRDPFHRTFPQNPFNFNLQTEDVGHASKLSRFKDKIFFGENVNFRHFVCKMKYVTRFFPIGDHDENYSY